jgi:hypothetical protein
MNVKYRLVAVSSGWLVQGRNKAKFDTLAFCKTLDEAVDYLFALKEINT